MLAFLSIPQNAVLASLLFFALPLYYYLISRFVSSILDGPRLTPLMRVLLSVFNSVLMSLFLLLPQATTQLSYLVLFVVFFVEFYLFHRDTVSRVLFVTLACVVHIMSLRSLCVAAVSLFTGKTFFTVVNDLDLLLLSTLITFLLLCAAVLLAAHFISAEQVRIINQHREQLRFMIAWLLVFTGYLVLNAGVYSIPTEDPFLSFTQLALPIAVLAGLYIVLLYAFATGSLLGYKEKNSLLEQEIQKEQQYRNSMMHGVIALYEFNLTQNEISSGGEHCLDERGEPVRRFDTATELNAHRLVHPDDLQPLLAYAQADYLVEQYQAGNPTHRVDYRRKMPDGEYLWVRANINLSQESPGGDIRGFAYISNIDEEKRTRLDLQYQAERDPLTGLYNKSMTARLIDEHLLSGGVGTLFLIDVDYFKEVNDSLGHLFGDAVLCELGEKLRRLFRSDDIVGRVGGDEFMAFLKHTAHPFIVEERAVGICASFRSTYQGTQQNKFSISSSVGIALAPDHGSSFDELYRACDVALYSSKNRGKNTYSIYSGEAFGGYQSNRTAIDSSHSTEQKSFKDNRIEYVFKILYGSATPVTAVYSVLELLAAHFKFSRGYIFESSEDGLTFSNTFEWCAPGISPQIQNLQNLPAVLLQNAVNAFHTTGMYVMKNADGLTPAERALLEPQGVKAMLQFGIFEGDRLAGFIGFDDCAYFRLPKGGEIDEISTACNVLAIFLVKQRAMEKAENNSRFLSVIMQNWDSYAYVIDRETRQFLFLNEKTRAISGAGLGDVCYEVLRGFDAPCEDCPVLGLTDALPSRFTREIYNEKLQVWTEATASNIIWSGQKACLINCIDISKFHS